MGALRVVLIVIFGLIPWWRPDSQPPACGVYISSRGFFYDAYFEKVILSASDTILSPKAAFLLDLVDTLTEKLHNRYPDRIFYNLHRVPPSHWPEVIYFIEELKLISKPYSVVYARSNRLIATTAHDVRASFRIAQILGPDTVQRAGSWQLPAVSWRSALVDSLWAKGLHF